jgi:hypothetical protein
MRTGGSPAIPFVSLPRKCSAETIYLGALPAVTLMSVGVLRLDGPATPRYHTASVISGLFGSAGARI